jgi:hypothetical protein
MTFRSQRIQVLVLVTLLQLNTAFTGPGDSRSAQGAAASFVQQAEATEQENEAKALPYPEESLEKLVKRIRELKALQPALDQHALPAILEKTGERVDEFFRNVVDLAAREKITEEKLDGQGNIASRLQVEDNYLILRRGTEIWGRVREYRMDEKGNPMDEVGLNNGLSATA